MKNNIDDTYNADICDDVNIDKYYAFQEIISVEELFYKNFRTLEDVNMG